MTTHELKILPEYFEPAIAGLKNFEIRYNDRNYQVGDTITLREWVNGNYTGREYSRKIQYLTDYKQKDGYVVMDLTATDKIPLEIQKGH